MSRIIKCSPNQAEQVQSHIVNTQDNPKPKFVHQPQLPNALCLWGLDLKCMLPKPGHVFVFVFLLLMTRVISAETHPALSQIQRFVQPDQITLANAAQATNVDASSTQTQPRSTLPSTAIAVAELPSLNQPIIDTAKALTPSQLQTLSQQILQLRQQHQIQMGVVIVNTTGEQDIFDYALEVAERWKLGNKGQDDGLLMLIAVQDRRIQILTGYGLEGVLPDIVVGRLIRNEMQPAFKQQQYAQGIANAINRIRLIMQGDTQTSKPNAGSNDLAASSSQTSSASPLQQALLLMLVVLLGAGAVSYFVKPLNCAYPAAPLIACLAWYSGVGILPSIALALMVFILVATTFAQILLQIGLQLLLSAGRSRGGGGGYSGGGGGFGGGGASGSW